MKGKIYKQIMEVVSNYGVAQTELEIANVFSDNERAENAKDKIVEIKSELQDIIDANHDDIYNKVLSGNYKDAIERVEQILN